ncbi:MAG: 6-phosphofructokinase, partial [candidate division NC10 bacterium]
MKTLAILVGGGPAPGINAVIAAATIEARNHGARVLGCYDGFKWLAEGDTDHVTELTINELTRIHFDGGSIIRTSRTNPAGTPEGIARVAETLKRLGVDHLITIGGDDTAYSASRVAKALPGLTVAHLPKTIDNDLPLPSDIVTFGFTTACNFGKDLVRNLMQDAATTERWFFVTVMGRRAGHLALGIGGAAGATLTVIAEEFAESKIGLDRIADILEGAIIKRRMQGREQGVALLSEGLAEKLDLETLGTVERDA